MANQSAKKEKKQIEESRSTRQLVIFCVTVLYILILLISIYTNGKELTTSDIFGFLVLSAINYGLHSLLGKVKGTYFESPLFDILGLNLAVMATVQFHWKFWFLYLIVPGYLLYLGSLKLFGYVKTIGKPAEGESVNSEEASQKTKKPKVFTVKHN